MVQNIIISLIINFVLRQLDKFNETIDWVKVKADAAVRIAAVIPGTWFDAQAIAAANVVIDAVACALHQKAALDEILHLVAEQKWAEAGQCLKDMVLEVWGSDDCPVEKTETAVAMVNAYTPVGEAAA